MNSTSTAPEKRGFDPVLALIVVFAAAGGGALVVWAKNWVVMPDELIYVQLSRAIAGGSLPIPGVGDSSIASYQLLYPTLIAPLVGLLKMPDAYPSIAVLNAWVMATAAIPAYLLTTYATGSRGAARWVALCAVVTPWLTFASKTLPDPTAYTAAAWATWAIARTAGPSARPLKGDLLALLAIALGFLVRNQFLLLFGVWFGTVVLAQVAAGAATDGLRGAARELIRVPVKRPVPVLVFVVVAALYEFEPSWLLGFYTSVTTVPNDALPNAGLPQELLNHANVLAFGLAALPVVLGLPWLLSGLVRIGDRAQNNTAIVILLTTCAVLYVATTFDMRFDPTERVIERYIFYVAPLWFVAMAAFFQRPPKSLPAFALPALGGVILLIATHPYGLDTALNYATNRVFSPTQIVLIGWQKAAELIGTSISGLVVLLMLVLCGFCWWAINRGRTALAQTLCFLFVSGALIAATVLTVPGTVDEQNRGSEQVFGQRDTAEKAWVQIVTGGAGYSLAYSRGSVVEKPSGKLKAFRPTENRSAWRDAVIWNSGLNSVYVPFQNAPAAGAPIPGRLRTLIPDWETGALTQANDDSAEYLLMATGDPRFAPSADALVTTRDQFALYRFGDDLHAAWAVRGLTPGGWVTPNDAILRVWAPRDAARTSTLQIKLKVSGTPGRSPDGFKVEGAKNVKQQEQKEATTFTWSARVPTGGHVDFKLVRGDAPVHVDRVDARS